MTWLLLLCSLATIAGAQNLKNDLSKIRSRYFQSSFELLTEYRFYDNGKLIETMQGRFVVKNTNYYLKMGDNEVLNNDRCYVAMYHEMKQVNLMAPQPVNSKDLFSLPLDSSLSAIASFAFTPVSSEEAFYTLQLKDGQYSTAVLYFNPATHELKRLRMQMRESDEFSDGLLEISIKSFRKNPTLSKDFFSEQRFITLGPKKQATLTPAYSNYNLYNHFNAKIK